MKNLFLRTTVAVLAIALLSGLVPACAALDYQEIYTSPGGSKNVLVLVNQNLFGLIGASLSQYLKDLEQEDHKVFLSKYNRGSAEEVKEYLKYMYGKKGVARVVFVGDLPSVMFKMEKSGDGIDAILAEGGLDKYPTDLFFTDLDGNWQDVDKDRVYETLGGNGTPEIYLGRIDASKVKDPYMSEANLVIDYFRRNHEYRVGRLVVPQRSVTFMDLDGLVHQAGTSEDSILSKLSGFAMTMLKIQASLVPLLKTWFLNIAYPLVADSVDFSATDLPKYLSKLSENREWMYVLAHGRPTSQTVFKNDAFAYLVPRITPELQARLDNWNVATQGPKPTAVYSIRDYNLKPFFYLIGSCLVGRYTEEDFLGGAYIFGRHTNGLTALAFTRVSNIQFPVILYLKLSRFCRYSIGGAFKSWMKTALTLTQILPSIDFNLGDRNINIHELMVGVKRGMVILGDPTLTLDPPRPVISEAKVTTQKYWFFFKSYTVTLLSLSGKGNINKGWITKYNWRSDRDGYLGGSRTLRVSPSKGAHTIYLKVRDNYGRWSSEAATVVSVN